MYHMCDCDDPYDLDTNPNGKTICLSPSCPPARPPAALRAPPPRPAGCKYHRPDGCLRKLKPPPPGEEPKPPRRGCPFCLTMPVITLLRKVSNHLEMVKANVSEERGRELGGVGVGLRGGGLGRQHGWAAHPHGWPSAPWPSLRPESPLLCLPRRAQEGTRPAMPLP